MFKSSKLKKIIKKGVEKTVKDFGTRTPKIYEHFFYGAVEIDPHNLVIWYVFQTDAEFCTAKESGLCDELTKATIDNLISLGYPANAFETAWMGVPMDKITIQGGSEEDKQMLLSALANRKASVNFTTQEDVDREANGDYFTYFK